MKLIRFVVLLLTVLLWACAQQKPAPPLLQPKEYWLVSTRYWDSKQGIWKPDQELTLDTISLVESGEENAKTFKLQTDSATLEVAKNLAGVSLLENKGVSVRSVQSAETEVERAPTYIKTVRLQITYQPNSQEQSEKTITGSLQLFRSRTPNYYQDNKTPVPIAAYLEGVSSAGYMKVPLPNVAHLKRQIVYPEPAQDTASQLVALTGMVFDKAHQHPTLTAFTICLLVFTVLGLSLVERKRLKERRQVALKEKQEQRKLLSSPDALELVARHIEGLLAGCKADGIGERLARLVSLEAYKLHWLQSPSSYIRTQAQEHIEAGKEALLKRSLKQSSYTDWLTSAKAARGSGEQCRLLRLLREKQNEQLYKITGSEKQIERKQRFLQKEISLYEQVSRKNILQALLGVETAVEWAVREQLVDSLEDILHKLEFLRDEMQKVRNGQTLNAWREGDISAGVNIAPENVQELEYRALRFQRAEKTLSAREPESVENLTEEYQKTEIRLNTQELQRKLGKESLEVQAQELNELDVQTRCLKSKYRSIAGDIEDLRRKRRKDIKDRT